MRPSVHPALLFTTLLAACSGSTADVADPANAGGTDTGSSGDDGSVDDATSIDDAGDDAGAGDDATADADPSSDASDSVGPPTDGAPAGTALRFVALGDTGKGNDAQKKIGDAIAAKCAKDGCDFVQLLGDNIYDSGVTSTDDPQWTTKFETPYGAVSLPFYAVLGNHDYGGNGTGNEFGKGKYQVDYTAKSTKWKLPAAHWQRVDKGVSMFGLDTNMIMYGKASDQKTAVTGWIGAAKTPWKIAFGHHPYYSNGPHGDAGKYEGIPYIPIASGQSVKDFFDSTICGKVDVYICGHDHSRQWIKDTCKGTELIVSGGGSATTDLKGKHPTWFQESSIGFVYVVVQGNQLTAEFVDETGATEFTRTLTK